MRRKKGREEWYKEKEGRGGRRRGRTGREEDEKKTESARKERGR